MLQVILVRHSHAESGNYNLDDKDRTLSALGIDVAKNLSKELLQQGYVPDLMISSDAVRAMETASILKEGMAYTNSVQLEEFIYNDYTTQEFVSFLQGLKNDAKRVMVVGHNPGIANMCYRLSPNQSIPFPPCTAVVLNFDVPNWESIEVGGAKVEQIVNA